MMLESEGHDGPKVRLHPPTVFFTALVAGYVIRLFVGGRLPISRALAEGVGGLVLIALGVAISAISRFAERGQPLTPSTPSDALFTDGPYRFSRNPIYLAMVLFGAGFGVATANMWMILTTIIAGAVLHFFVIVREEAYLASRFGPEYEAYRPRVRRWI